MTCPKNKARPIRHPAQVPDRNGKIFYTSITSLSHISKGLGIAALEAQAAGLPCIISDSVPSECRVTDLAESLDLNLPIDEWADVVLEKQGTIRKNTIDDIKKSGFDVKQNVVKLEEFYFNSVEE